MFGKKDDGQKPQSFGFNAKGDNNFGFKPTTGTNPSAEKTKEEGAAESKEDGAKA